MTLDEQIANAAARAAVAARNGDDDAWREWSDRATRLLDQRDLRQDFIDHADDMREWAKVSIGCAPVSFYARPAS